ncbi:hypothetical protein ACGFIV_32285 [Sphaerisporangium sp. NPDC049003]|uniref:hypothetical protein n=1 Tax=Sphaerisporangium sp. NPDC049003 TaxID=3364517 RepID=UPI00371E7D0F
MSHTDLRGLTPEVTFHTHGHNTITISVDKRGGDTIIEARFCDDGSCWYRDFDLSPYLRGEIAWKN